MRLLLLSVVTLLLAVSSRSQAQPQFGPRPPTRCEALRQENCLQFYNRTVVPNGFDHYTQAEAAMEMSHYTVMIQSVNCSDESLFLLCALYFPICTEYGHELSIPPCRSVCLRVRRGCEKHFSQRQLPWPERLNCDNLPNGDGRNSELCMSDNGTESVWTPTPTKPSPRGGSISHDVGGTTEEATVMSSIRPCSDPLMPSDRKQDSFGGLLYCRAPCNSFYDKDELQFASRWILAWSCVSLVAVTVSLLFFYTNKQRFKDIERPIVYLTCCFVPVGVAYIVGFSEDRTSIACYGTEDMGMNSLNQTAQRTDDLNASCIITFILTYYFGMAANAWWVVLTLYWFMAACIKWDVRRLSDYFPYYHFFAWFVPVVQVAIVWSTQAIDGDPLSNTCSPGNSNLIYFTGFVLSPLIVFLILGAVFLVSGLVTAGKRSSRRRDLGVNDVQLQSVERLSADSQGRLVSQRSTVGSDSRTESRTESRENEVLTASSVYSLLYLFIVALLLVCVLYEHQSRLRWEKDLANCLLDNVGCDSRSRPPVGVYLLKFLLTLAGAVMTALWAWSSKLLLCRDCKESYFNWTPKECVRSCQQPRDDLITTSV